MIKNFTVEDAYRELANLVGVHAITPEGPGDQCIEHTDAHDDIEQVLEDGWDILRTDDSGRYSRTYIVTPDASYE